MGSNWFLRIPNQIFKECGSADILNTEEFAHAITMGKKVKVKILELHNFEIDRRGSGAIN